MLLNLDLVKGPLYIICQLRLISLQKQLFIMELRRGIEVRIPKKLSQSGMSHYFRFYDSIINIVKTNIHSVEKP